METTTVVLDADFIQKIASIQRVSPDVLYDKLMADLKCSPVVHPFVIEHELFACSLARRKVEEALLRVVPYSEFIKSDTQRQIYIQTFLDAYRLVTFEKYGQEGVPPTDIFTHCASNDYGEIHSVLMAAELGIPIFYSNTIFSPMQEFLKIFSYFREKHSPLLKFCPIDDIIIYNV